MADGSKNLSNYMYILTEKLGAQQFVSDIISINELYYSNLTRIFYLNASYHKKFEIQFISKYSCILKEMRISNFIKYSKFFKNFQRYEKDRSLKFFTFCTSKRKQIEG